MGQIIEVKTTKVNKTLIFDLNRSVSGQEGMTFNNISEASLIPDVSGQLAFCLLYTSPSPRDRTRSRMPSSA